MSQENVETVRRAWEAGLHHDNTLALSLYHCEVTGETTIALDSPTTYRGVDGMREFWRNALSVFTGFTSTVEEWIDAGDDVVAVLRWEARGKQSGVPVVKREAHVWTIRDGKLWRLRVYESRAAALEAVGLEE